MHIYTQASELATFLANGGGFVSDAVFRIVRSCLSLAIQHYSAVQAIVTSPNDDALNAC
jgi:hypothetical protein